MKMSRFSLLLAVALFVVPVTVFGNDTPAEKTEQNDSGNQQDKNKQTDPNQPESKPTSIEPTISTATSTQSTTDKAKGMFAAITGLAITGKGKVFDGLDKVASLTFIDAALKKLATFESLKGGKFETNIPTINRVIVSAIFATALYAAYKLYKSQQQDDIDELNNDFNDEDIL